MEKHETRYREGIWIGLIPRTDEDLVMTANGVVKATSIRLRSEDSKWDAEAVKSGRGYPWRPVPHIEGSHIPVHIADDLTVTRAEDEDTRLEVQMPQAHDAAKDLAEEMERRRMTRRFEETARQMKVTEDMIKRYGYSDGCPGCRKIQLGEEGARAHSQVCRRRVQGEMEKTEGGRKRTAVLIREGTSGRDDGQTN